ncbi:MAG: aldo/keto reductase [Patescibacteria group bacterium]
MNKESTIQLRSGNAMPVLGLGTWQLLDNTDETVAYALDLGYRMIDTSSDYRTHPGINKALKQTSINRNEIYVVTKVKETDNAYEATKDYIEELGLEYADLILIHRPPTSGAGEDLWKDLIRARNEGYTRDIGVSNYSVDQINQLIDETSEIPTVNQIEWSPFGYSSDMKLFCDKNNIVIQAYSPLTRAKRLADPELSSIARKYDKSAVQVLVRWNLQGGTVPLPKANLRGHQEDNIDVFDFELASEDMQRLDNLNEQYSSLGGLPYVE